MKLIFISDDGHHHHKLNIKLWSHIVLPLFIFSLLAISAIAAKNYYQNTDNEIINDNEIKLLSKFDLLIKKASTLEALVLRLNALGTTLAAKANLDIQSFQLSKEPALGGLDTSPDLNLTVISETDLVKSIERIEKGLALQKARFSSIQNSIEDKSLLKKGVNKPNDTASYLKTVHSYSSPVKRGYISSSYGNKRDPVNGHQSHHSGIDIAAQQGSKIHAIASGFVTFTGRKGDYGNIVEIHHSDSLKSRYAHLDEINVEKGEVIRKGSNIATMGRTGRATGPHLHLEVWEDGQAVNPESYIDIALKSLNK